MRVLVTAASRYGGTAEIAEAIADVLAEQGLEVETSSPDEVETLDSFDAVVVGSAVYYGRWLDVARAFVGRHAAELRTKPTWLFSSGPIGPPDHPLPRKDIVNVDDLLAATNAVDHCILPGRLDRSRLRLRDRGVVSTMHAAEGDFRDWDAVEAFGRQIAERLNLSLSTGQAGESR